MSNFTISLSNVFYVRTIRLEFNVADNISEADASEIFESSLFDLSYISNVHYELSDEWPFQTAKQFTFAHRKFSRPDVYILHRTRYNLDLLRFYKRAVASQDMFVEFISLYHILEYYFVLVRDRPLYGGLRATIANPTFITDERGLDELISQVLEHRSFSKDADMLRVVLEEFSDEARLIKLMAEYEAVSPGTYSKKSSCFGYDLDPIQLRSGHVFGPIASRLNTIRNALVHSSDRHERKQKYVPGKIADQTLRRELPLLRYLAEQVVIRNATTF